MYTPSNVPASADQLPAFIERENRVIAENLNAGIFYFRMLYKEPAKVYEGMTVLADGTNWDPHAGAHGSGGSGGNGKGVYTYYAGQWHKLG
jgi:hypothetical protein